MSFYGNILNRLERFWRTIKVGQTTIEAEENGEIILTADKGITIAANKSTNSINFSGPDNYTSIVTDSGTVKPNKYNDILSIRGGNGITTSGSNNALVIKSPNAYTDFRGNDGAVQAPGKYNDTLTIAGDNGISTTANNQQITIDGSALVQTNTISSDAKESAENTNFTIQTITLSGTKGDNTEFESSAVVNIPKFSIVEANSETDGKLSYTFSYGDQTTQLDIPLDLILVSSEVIIKEEPFTGHDNKNYPAGAYLHLQFKAEDAAASHCYINVTSLLEVKGGATTTINVTVDKYNSTVTAEIIDKSINTKHLADSAITTDKIADNSITTNKINDNAITVNKLDTQTCGQCYIITIEDTSDVKDDYFYILEHQEEIKTGPTNYVIVNRRISNNKNKYSRRAYVYDSQTKMWVPLSSDWNVNNIYFDKDLITNFEIGKYKIGLSGMATIPAKGKNLNEVWEDVFINEINTNLQVKKPSCIIRGDLGNPDIQYYEVGATSEDQTVSLSLSKGAYKYGYGYLESKNEQDPEEGALAKTVVTTDGTGAEVNNTLENCYTITWNGASQSNINGIFTCGGGIQKQMAPTEILCEGSIAYKNAGNPVSNLGKIYANQVYPNGRTETASKVLARWYYPMYQGFTYSDGINGEAVITNITEARIKEFLSIVDEQAFKKIKTTSATANRPWRQYYYIIPSEYNWQMNGAKDGNNIDCTVHKETTILTFNNVGVNYDIYYINNAADYDTLSISWSIIEEEGVQQ